jgi:hypothetical protein
MGRGNAALVVDWGGKASDWGRPATMRQTPVSNACRRLPGAHVTSGCSVLSVRRVIERLRSIGYHRNGTLDCCCCLWLRRERSEPAPAPCASCHPPGTTIAGITELESAGMRGAFIRAVNRAAQRARELAG